MFLNLGFSHQASLPSPSTTWRWPTTLATWSSTAPPTTRKWAFTCFTCSFIYYFVHTCDDYTLCDGRSDTNCVEISRYEQTCDFHIIFSNYKSAGNWGQLLQCCLLGTIDCLNKVVSRTLIITRTENPEECINNIADFNTFTAIWSWCLPEELSIPRDWHHPCHRRLWGQQVSFVGHIPTGQRVTNVVGALPAYDMQYTWQCRQLNTFLFSFAIGAKYALASDACIRAKVSVRFKKISGSISNVF